MKTKFLAVSFALTALLLAGCQGNEPAAGTGSPPPEQSTPVSPEQSESVSPEQSESVTPQPSDTEAPTQSSGATSVFTPGTWLGTAGDGNQQYYFFYKEGWAGSTANLEYGIGVAFSYEPGEDGSVVFHMGAVDISSSCTVEVTDAEHITLLWEDGSREDLAYVSPLGAGEFTFYSNNELCDLAIAYYAQASGAQAQNLTAGAVTNEDGTVTVQVYENLGDHNSTAAWYTVDRFTGQGTDVNSGEAVDLSTAAG